MVYFSESQKVIVYVHGVKSEIFELGDLVKLLGRLGAIESRFEKFRCSTSSICQLFGEYLFTYIDDYMLKIK